MSATAWWALLHPALMILFVYPVVGATIRLGILVRERRLGITEQPAIVPREHADHGRWLCTGAVVAALVALLWCQASVTTDVAQQRTALVLASGCLGSLLALWRVRSAGWRAGCALLCWAGLLALGTQPALLRGAVHPQVDVWPSHFWAGWLLCGLLLLATAARPELQRSPTWRRWHVLSGGLTIVLLAMLAISGCRDLLALGLAGV